MKRSTSGCVTRIMPMFAPRRTPPCFTTSVTWLTMFMNDTGPDATPVGELPIAPCGRRNSYVMPVPPPVWWMVAAAFACSMIPESESGTSRTKHAASWPLVLPALTRHGVFGMNSRASITSLMAAKNLSRFSPVSAMETAPTTRRTISDHSSSGRPFKSLSEYRLLTTFLALIPSCWDFRRGETAVLFPVVLPIAALIIFAFLTGSPKVDLGFKNNYARRIATQGVNLDCALDNSVGSSTSSGAEYTPLRAQCQYLVAIFFCHSIECILAADRRECTWSYLPVPVFESNSW